MLATRVIPKHARIGSSRDSVSAAAHERRVWPSPKMKQSSTTIAKGSESNNSHAQIDYTKEHQYIRIFARNVSKNNSLRRRITDGILQSGSEISQ
jgi:hypothetical protein